MNKDKADTEVDNLLEEIADASGGMSWKKMEAISKMFFPENYTKREKEPDSDS